MTSHLICGDPDAALDIFRALSKRLETSISSSMPASKVVARRNTLDVLNRTKTDVEPKTGSKIETQNKINDLPITLAPAESDSGTGSPLFSQYLDFEKTNANSFRGITSMNVTS